jgi:GMP synthase-like glutamine amidotransferase
MILVVQFRQDVTEAHEQKCISRHIRQGEEVRFVSIFDESVPFEEPAKLLQGVRKLILGGSGAVSFGEGHDHTDYEVADFILKRVKPLVLYVLENDFPTLGVCLGHHIIGYHAGEPIVYDKEMAETGFLEIQITPAGHEDPIFAGFPPSFVAVVGHEDSLVHAPEGSVVLAKTDYCPTHLLRYGRNVYSTQFHSEMDADDLAYRMKMFPHYAATARNLTREPMPFALKVLENFLK